MKKIIPEFFFFKTLNIFFKNTKNLDLKFKNYDFKEFNFLFYHQMLLKSLQQSFWS